MGKSKQVDTIIDPLDEAFPSAGPAADIDSYEGTSINIDEGNIRTEFVRVSSDIAFWGKRFASCHREWLAGKLVRDEVRAATYLELRETLEALESKKPTEATISARVDIEPRVREAEARVVETEYNREAAKAVVTAISAKRDMLISLGAIIRAEMAPSSLRERDPFTAKDGE